MRKLLIVCVAVVCFSVSLSAQNIPTAVLVNIVKAEDERRFDKTLEDLLKNRDEKIRVRAALAAGRIGDERAVSMLVNLLETDSSVEVGTMAAFALGEIESMKGADAILKILAKTSNNDSIRARAVEAAGKIAAANAKDGKSKLLGEAILDALEYEDGRRSKPNTDAIRFGLTAVLRVRPEEGDFIAAKFLTALDASIRADAANTLSRLRAKNANEPLRAILLSDDDATARANAARALGAAEDQQAFDLLLESAASDEDSRVRVSAIRSLGSLKDNRAADKLLERGNLLLAAFKKSKSANPSEKSELLEIATTLGRISPNSNDEKTVNFLRELRKSDKYRSAETEIAFAKISPKSYINFPIDENLLDWQSVSSHAQGLAEFAKFDSANLAVEKNKAAEKLKAVLIAYPQFYTDAGLGRATPDILRAYAEFKNEDSSEFLRSYLISKIPITRNSNETIFIRAAAAELLGEQSASEENISTLKKAFSQALLTDKNSNDAQLAILGALFKLDKKESVGILLVALNAPDQIVRQKASELLRDPDLQKDFPGIAVSLKNAQAKNAGKVLPYTSTAATKLGQVLNTNADYTRAVSRKNARAILTTEKGVFTIEFAPEDAPLTVDNFIKLAKANYFNGLTIHRVVPNFVMQDGDPRGDGNGGPGWSIRCEINTLAFERGAIGMALSGKDTGGSQWFAAHSAQPHLDGGYTVFGKVNETDMKVVDNLVRGDKILTVKIVEEKRRKPAR